MPDLDEFYDDDVVFDDVVTDLEHKRRLELQRSKGVRVAHDLSENTPLRSFYDHRRVTCVAALKALTVVNPADPVAIVRLQAQIAEFISFQGWIRETVEASAQAHTELQGTHRGQDPDSD